MAKYFSVVRAAGKTLWLYAERKSDGKFWNGSGWQVAETYIVMSESTNYSLKYSEYHSDTQPNAHALVKVLDSADNALVWKGEFVGAGLGVSGTPVSGYVDFSTVYTEVRDDTDRIVSVTQAKKAVNRALRIIANDRHWNWKTDDDPYTVTTADGTEQYTIPVSVKQIIGAYSDYYKILPTVEYGNFLEMNFHNRTSGIPRRIYLAGGNVIMPDPIPNGAYSIYLIYQRLFNLVDDTDTFPCPHDFVDAIATLAKAFCAALSEKDGLSREYKDEFKLMLGNLRQAELSGEIYIPGERGYMP